MLKRIKKKNSANSAQVLTGANNSPTKEIKNNSTLTEKKSENRLNKELVCSPQKLRQGDILTLIMNKSHGGYLEIITPSKEHIFLSSEDGDKLLEDARIYKITPYYAAPDFALLSELKIATAKAMTLDYKGGDVNGNLLTARLFAESGKYKILLSKDSF